jgi:hypothetical protein
MFDFGHNVTVKELKENLQAFAKTSDEPTLRLQDHPRRKQISLFYILPRRLDI